jgi:hypothetical protein
MTQISPLLTFERWLTDRQRRCLMSLFSTLAHEGTLTTRVFSRRGLVTMFGAALLVISSIVVITNSASETPVAAVNTVTDSMTQEEFIRLNTTALDRLVPAPVIEHAEDPFFYWNTTALEGLTASTSRSPEKDVDSFLYWNTTALEYPNAEYVEPESGPR